jgi:hypothetical protein
MMLQLLFEIMVFELMRTLFFAFSTVSGARIHHVPEFAAAQVLGYQSP